VSQGPGERPQRVTVMHPRTGAVRRVVPRPVAHEIDDQTLLGDLLVRSLVRAQLGLVLRTVTLLGVLLGGLPLVFALVPVTRHARLLGLPLPWLLLGVAVYPALVGLGALHVRMAQRSERAFVDLVERSRR
jgi:hypothetical protein